MNPYVTRYQRRNPRLFALAVLAGAAVALLGAGLFWRQVWPRGRYEVADFLAVFSGQRSWGDFIEGRRPAYDQRERQQVLRRVLQPGPRGDIVDRKGRQLVHNTARYSVVLYLDEMRSQFNVKFDELRRAWLAEHRDDGTEVRRTINVLELRRQARLLVAQEYLDQANRLLGRSDTLDAAAFEQHYNWNLLLPYPLLKDLTLEDYARFNAEMPVASPMQTYAEAVRAYPHGSLAAHTLGFVGLSHERNAEDDSVLKPEAIKVRTFAMKGKEGRMGLEQIFDAQLRGGTGGEIWIVDPAGHLYERTASQVPQPGQTLRTSLDMDLQRAAEHALESRRLIGSVAALDVRTGEVLALASKPDFDLNNTVPYLSRAVNDDIVERGAWLNRATQGLYPPGSTFKLVSASAALRAGRLDGHATVNCPGVIKIGDRYFKCHSTAGHGAVDLEAAIEESCNVYFYTLGGQTGGERIAAEARLFGLDSPAGLELPEARGMIVPDAAWKKLRRPEHGPWSAGDSAMLAIGQSYLRVTPLQMACFAASLARDELRTVPTLLYSPERNPAEVNPGGRRTGLAPADRAMLLAGMERAAQSGTARLVRVPGVRVAGKTGTAQVLVKGEELTLAWFIGFAPADNPRIAVAVAIEGDDPNDNFHGGTTAGPIAQAVLAEYFKQYPPAPAPLPLVAATVQTASP